MDLSEVLGLVSAGGTWVAWFAWAMWERRRNAQLQDERIRDHRAWMNYVTKQEVFPTKVNGEG